MAGKHTTPAPREFIAALSSLRTVRPRPEITLTESAGPARVAPFSAALLADVRDTWAQTDDLDLASGRLVILHDPDGQTAWNGVFRLIALTRALVDPEMSTDPLAAEVTWSWLTDSLVEAGASFHSLSGTVTTVSSQSFGHLSGREPEQEIELRASWTPNTEDLAPHLEGWLDFSSIIAGLNPLEPGVTALPLNRKK